MLQKIVAFGGFTCPLRNKSTLQQPDTTQTDALNSNVTI